MILHVLGIRVCCVHVFEYGVCVVAEATQFNLFTLLLLFLMISLIAGEALALALVAVTGVIVVVVVGCGIGSCVFLL